MSKHWLVPSEFLIAGKYWTHQMPMGRKILAALSVGQMLRVLMRDDSTESSLNQYFVITDERNGTIQALHSLVDLESRLKIL
jgi:hypothetical protein